MNNIKKILTSVFFIPVKSFLKFIIDPFYFIRIFVNDIKSFAGIEPGKSRMIFIAGYPKSGTTWVESFVSYVPGYSPRILSGSIDIIRKHNLPESAFSRVPKYGFSSIKTHINPSENNINILVGAGIDKIIVMFRDPRDIVVSNYYYILKHNPWLPSDPWYLDYNEVTKEEAITHAIDMLVDDFQPWVEGWLNISRNSNDLECYVLKYEELRSDHVLTFRNILSYYGIELSDRQFKKTLLLSERRSSPVFIKNILPGKRTTKRSGNIGDWKFELSSKQKKYLKERIGSLLIELGYENDLNW